MSNSPFKDRFLIKGKLQGGSEGGTVYTGFDEPIEPPEEEALLDPFVDKFDIARKIVFGEASGSVITPLSTANQLSATIVLTDSGSDLSATDHLRQGVEIITAKHRYNRTLPILGTGRDDHTIEQFEFGFPRNIENINGSIEPFTIRDVVLGKSTFVIEPHSIKGQLQDGNSDEFGRTSLILQSVPKSLTSQSIKPYIDSTELLGNSNTGSIKIPGVISDVDPMMIAFDETAFDTFLSSSLTGPFSKFLVSMSLGRSGSQRDFGIVADKDKSATAGFIYDGATATGLDSLSFGDTQKYQRIGFQRELDNATGSYPTRVRTGDKDRKGNFKVKFDDSRTIVFDTNQFLDVQRNLHSASIYLAKPYLSQSIDSGKKPRFYPFVGQTPIERATSASLYATGTVRKGVGDSYIRFETFGGDDLSPFVEEFIFDDKVDIFWKTGSKVQDVGVGFVSPLLSKTKIEIDLSPVAQTNLTSSTGSPNYPMGYFNLKRKKWEGIGTGKPFVSAGGGRNKTTMNRLTYGFNVSEYNATTLTSQYPAWQQSALPISNFGFPIHPKFHATSSQLYHLSSSIQHPFLLEKIVYEFSASIKLPIGADRGNLATFFILNQRDNFYLSTSFASLDYDNSTTLVVSTSIPNSLQLSAGGPRIDVNSSRDLVSFFGVGALNSNITAAEREAKQTDLNLVANPTGSFVLSGTVKSPSASDRCGLFQINSTTIYTSNQYGGRNSLGAPTGRDFINSVLGIQISGTFPAGGADIIPNAVRFKTNPYILLPSDKLIFGWQVPMVYTLSGSEIALHPEKGRLILYGSLIRNQTEYHDTLNQPLTTNSLFEVIGDDPILDQYDTEYFQMLSGSYIDDYITGSMSHNTRLHRQVLGSSFGQNGATSGSFARNTQIVSSNERYFDSVPPNPSRIHIANGKRIVGASVNSITVGHYIVSIGENQDNYDTDWWRSFPFEPKYRNVPRELNAFSELEGTHDLSGNVLDPPVYNKRLTIRQTTDGNTIVHLTKIGAGTFDKSEIPDRIKHYYGIGDFVSGTVQYLFKSRSGATVIHGEGSVMRGWKYGLASALPVYNRIVFRYNRFGQFRDMLEQGNDGKFYDANSSQVLSSPVQIFFSGSEPYQTDSSNKSIEATSSLPYFDGISRN